MCVVGLRFNSLLGVLVFGRVDVGDDPGPGKAQGPLCQVALDSVHPPPLPFHFPLGPTPLYIHRITVSPTHSSIIITLPL